jgi:hypothetical protein
MVRSILLLLGDSVFSICAISGIGALGIVVSFAIKTALSSMLFLISVGASDGVVIGLGADVDADASVDGFGAEID